MCFVAGSNISHNAVGRFSPERMAGTWVGASIRSARISAMVATVLGHGSGVESFVGGLLSARLTEALSGGRWT